MRTALRLVFSTNAAVSARSSGVAIEYGIDSMSANTSTPMMSAPSSGQTNGSCSALTAPHPGDEGDFARNSFHGLAFPERDVAVRLCTDALAAAITYVALR